MVKVQLRDMMAKIKNIGWICGCFFLMLCGCTAEEGVSGVLSEGTVNVRLLASAMMEGEASDTECQVYEVAGFRFEDGMLKEIFDSLTPTAEGIYQLRPEEKKGTVYFLANAASVIQNASFRIEETSLDDFLNLVATADDMTANGLVMSGQADLNSEGTEWTVALKRSLARIDLDTSFEGIEVSRVAIQGISSQGYVNGRSEVRRPAGAELVTLVKDNLALSNEKKTLFYVCEQEADQTSVEIQMTSTDGAWHRLKATLPALKRNTIYTLKVYGNGADTRVEVITDDWVNGVSSGSEQVLKGVVDKTASQLSDGVTISQQGDTVCVPYWKSDFRLALKAEAGASLVVNGIADGVTVTSQQVTRAMQHIVDVNVTSRQKMPGSVQEYVYLDVYEQAVHTGRVVLVFNPNPIQLTGRLSFDENAVCDFNGYQDGELGTLVLPEGKLLNAEVDSDEAPWIKIASEGTSGVYRILAGWKPNDPLADGRVQEARLVVTDAGGSHREVYTVKRQNWGLPVVNMNGIWWCKYNLRGNVKNFADQILIKDDPVPEDENLFDYLQRCSDEELLHVLGDQYQAGNPDGLKPVYDGSSFSYEGYQPSVSANFGTMLPTTMAPEGYQIPDYDDYRFFTWNNNSNLGYYNPGVFNNNLGQRLDFSVSERELMVDGVLYGTVGLYDFVYENVHWTIEGLGHQWSETGISPMTILLATYGNANNTWSIEGYPKSTGQGNWFKYTNSNASKTRTIRCVKTPVEYIYE